MIKAENLFFSYDDSTQILKDVSFTIKEGEFVSLFGPNGGGKTTLLHLIMGFHEPLRGKLLLNGVSPKKARPLIGWVPQSFHPDPLFPISVLEVVLIGNLKKCTKQEALKALDRVGMKKFAPFPFTSLSGGQAQRVLMARALAGEPKILLLDEPTANVDPEAQKEIYAILKSLKGKVTIVMVTHDLPNSLELSDRFLCVQHEVTEMAPNQICHHYSHGLYHTELS